MSHLRTAIYAQFGDEVLSPSISTTTALEYLLAEYNSLEEKAEILAQENQALAEDRQRLRDAHWRHPDVDRWVSSTDVVQVEALSGQGGEVVFSGTFAGYSTSPQVKIKLAPGTYKFWLASLVREKREKTS
jgi:hypothetical protein